MKTVMIPAEKKIARNTALRRASGGIAPFAAIWCALIPAM
jgi:hypothetical protein